MGGFAPMHVSELRLLTARPGDLSRILEILNACRDELPTLDAVGAAQLLSRNIRRGSVLLAETDGNTAGVSVWSPPLRRLSLLAVLPAYRRRGIAAALLRETLNRLPPEDVTLDTYREEDPRGAAAHALYEKFGFRPAETLEGYALPMQRYRLYRK